MGRGIIEGLQIPPDDDTKHIPQRHTEVLVCFGTHSGGTRSSSTSSHNHGPVLYNTSPHKVVFLVDIAKDLNLTQRLKSF